MLKKMTIGLVAVLFLTAASAGPAWACLVPASPIFAKVAELGPNPGGLEQMRVYVYGFEMTDFSSYGVGCTIGLSLESKILGSPLWLAQKRGLTLSAAVLDVDTNITNQNFTLNPSALLDFNGQTMGLGYFDWPIPVAFAPFTLTAASVAANGAPEGEVVLEFEVILKPDYSVEEGVEDLVEFGFIASDYSLTYYGITYFLATSQPMVTKIEEVIWP
ncbi:MAG: hypothetical protein K0U98_03085 [Deltaproteobacteria bacterium]|nr:hypothetical protein [Deltaproteobacteria bacterium]